MSTAKQITDDIETIIKVATNLEVIKPHGPATKIYDIETLINFFLYMDICYKTKVITIFRIGLSHNDLVAFVHYLKTSKLNLVGFNNISFDSQVIQYIINNADYWVAHNYTGIEINEEIYKYVQGLIGKQNSGAWADYPEWKLTVPQLDAFKIWHFDNKAKMTGLAA